MSALLGTFALTRRDSSSLKFLWSCCMIELAITFSILKGGSYNANHLFLARAAKLGHVAIIITTN
jgi:hypothetical protein